MGKEKRNKFLKALQGGPLVGLFRDEKKNIFNFAMCLHGKNAIHIYIFIGDSSAGPACSLLDEPRPTGVCCLCVCVSWCNIYIYIYIYMYMYVHISMYKKYIYIYIYIYYKLSRLM
jgi:hypothetical protein